MNFDFNNNNFVYSEDPLNLHSNDNKNRKVKKEDEENGSSSFMDFVDFGDTGFDVSNVNHPDSRQQRVFEQLMSKDSGDNSNSLNNFLDVNVDNNDPLNSHFDNMMPYLSTNYSPSNILGHNNEQFDNDFNFHMNQMINDDRSPNTEVNPPNVENKMSSFINELVDVFDDNMNITNDEPVMQQGLLTNIDTLRTNDVLYWRNCLKYVENVKFGKSPDFTRSDFVKEQENIKQMSTIRDSETYEYVKVPEDPHLFPYKITIGDIPPTSRVETQVKLNICIEPAPKQNIIHLSTNSIPRRKYMLADPISTWEENSLEHVLFMEAHVLKVSDKSAVTPCERCCKREERRFSRRKSGATDADLWAVNDDREALIFNHKQLCVLNQHGCSTNTGGTPDSKPPSNSDSKYITFTSRFVCYCRHQKEPAGFEIVVLIKNHKGEILGKKTSSSIKVVNINQRTKSIKDTASDVSDTASSVASESSYATDYSNSRQSSIDYSASSYQSELDHHSDALMNERNPRTFKSMNNLSTSTQELLQHQGQGSFYNTNQDGNLGISAISNKMFSSNSPSSRISPIVARNSSHSNLSMVKNNSQGMMQQQKPAIIKPGIFKIIPNSGPTSGAVEVTILGENFTPNTDVVFGHNKALSVNFWGPTTIVAKAPPAHTPGPVQVVSLVDSMYIPESIVPNPEAVFTYVDQNDKQLLELALKIVDNEKSKEPVNSNNMNQDRNIAQNLLFEQQGENKGHSDTEVKHEAHKVVLSLLNSGLKKTVLDNLNFKNEEGRTLLHLACLKSHIELIIFLLSNNAKVNSVDNYGYTPLHFACLTDDIRVMKMLIAMNCDKYSPTYCNDLSTPLELYLNNYRSQDESKNYDEVYELLKEDDKKDFRNGSMDQLSAFSNESGFQQHISTMVSQSSISIPENHKFDIEPKRLTDDLHLKEPSSNKVGKISGNESTTSAVTVNESVNSSLESQPPLYDDLFPESALQKPSEEFEDIQTKKLIEMSLPSLSTHTTRSLLPPIDSLSMKLDLIETTDMEDRIANTVDNKKTRNGSSSGTEMFDDDYDNQRHGLGIIKTRYKNKMLKLNMFNEDLMNQFKLMKSKQKEFDMDTKLIFFWIPFLLILISTVLVLTFSSSNENSIADSWNVASNNMRTKLANFFFGKQRWQMFVKDAIHQGEIKIKEAFNAENIQSIF